MPRTRALVRSARAPAGGYVGHGDGSGVENAEECRGEVEAGRQHDQHAPTRFDPICDGCPERAAPAIERRPGQRVSGVLAGFEERIGHTVRIGFRSRTQQVDHVGYAHRISWLARTKTARTRSLFSTTSASDQPAV